MGTQEAKVMVALEANKPPECIKSCPLTQGSYRLKAITPKASTSRGYASSNSYHSMSRNELSIPMISKREKVPRVNSLKSAKKRKATNKDTLRKTTGDALPRVTVRFKNSLAETNHTNQDFSTKKKRLDPVVLNGSSQSSTVTDDHGPNTNSALRESEAGIVENPNLKSETDPCDGQSLPKWVRVKRNERKEKRKNPSKKVDKKVPKQNKEEMLRKLAKDLIRENSKLKEQLLLFSEKCHEINEENNSIMEELEKKCGLDAISDIRAKNPATANGGTNSNGGSAKDSNDSTTDQNEDTPDAPKVEVD